MVSKRAKIQQYDIFFLFLVCVLIIFVYDRTQHFWTTVILSLSLHFHANGFPLLEPDSYTYYIFHPFISFSREEASTFFSSYFQYSLWCHFSWPLILGSYFVSLFILVFLFIISFDYLSTIFSLVFNSRWNGILCPCTLFSFFSRLSFYFFYFWSHSLRIFIFITLLYILIHAHCSYLDWDIGADVSAVSPVRCHI